MCSIRHESLYFKPTFSPSLIVIVSFVGSVDLIAYLGSVLVSFLKTGNKKQ